MRKFLLGMLILIFGIAIGLGAAFGLSKWWQPALAQAASPVNVPDISNQQQTKTPIVPATQRTPNATFPGPAWTNDGRQMGSGMMGRWGNNTAQGAWGMGRGLMGSWNNNSGQGSCGMRPGIMGQVMMGNWQGNVSSGQRLTIDQALERAENYITSVGQDLAIAEIMEFNNNFYVIVKETEVGRGAFELLIDPFTGFVMPEMGPNMMWNVKYGHMGSGQAVENTLTIEQAIQQGQPYLEANLAGAQLESDGTSF